jgi:hypothetical protein
MRTFSSLTGLLGIRSPLFSLFVYLISTTLNAQPAVLDSAVARDANGNGYIDGIEVYFDKSLSFPPTFPLTNISVTSLIAANSQVITVNFPVNSVQPMDSIKSKYILALSENTSSFPNSPQTAWRLYVSIIGMDSFPSVPHYQCNDGAGPVIWSVVKTITSISDRTQDVVRVTFSEPIQGKDGALFTPAAVKPQNVFYDYRKNADGTWDTTNIFSPGLALNGVDSLYINSFTQMVNDSTLEFVMSNGKDLTTSDYLNIDVAANKIYDSRAHFGGGAGVAPVVDNRKVQVNVMATPVINPDVPKAYGTSSTTFTLHSVNGKKIKCLSEKDLEQNRGSLKFTNRYGQKLRNGVYFLVMLPGSRTISRKVIIAQ